MMNEAGRYPACETCDPWSKAHSVDKVLVPVDSEGMMLSLVAFRLLFILIVQKFLLLLIDSLPEYIPPYAIPETLLGN